MGVCAGEGVLKVVHTLIPALGRQRQADLCEFETNLVYKVNSWIAMATQRISVLIKTTLREKQEKEKKKVRACRA
jgi:hypothetical protein